ncbi:S1 family peptidase [Amycolatopsis anabasis]|uniref:S1 family peptidase n=1 Tax=Amycolatopsis anabasis TaxID=1840409 RepID=UPI00131B030C|nr:serine protease [Amycolatopsis anabasis]
MKKRIAILVAGVAAVAAGLTTGVVVSSPDATAPEAPAAISQAAGLAHDQQGQPGPGIPADPLALRAAANPEGGGDVSPMIVGGEEVKQPYSFVGSLQVKRYKGEDGFHSCGASLITGWLGDRYGQWAVTAAHCVDNMPASALGGRAENPAQASLVSLASRTRTEGIDWTDPAQFRIRFGSLDRKHGGVVVGISQIVRHPSWGWTGPGDVALLRLSGPVNLKPALVLPADRQRLMREIGWGYTTPDRSDKLPMRLRQIDVPFLDPSECAAAGIGEGEYCLADAFGGPCNGDSGTGGLQQQGDDWRVVVGLTSRGAGEQLCGATPAVYTDLSAYLPWMKQVVFQLPPGVSAANRELTAAGL